MKHGAYITVESEYTDDGHLVDCIYAHCDISDETVGPIWGTEVPSIKRALMELRRECGSKCGNSVWHYLL